MNLREGKSGVSESVFALITALCVSGLFAFSSERAFSHGNSTYVSIPIACGLAFAVFMLCAWAIKRSGMRNLSELFDYSLGRYGHCAAVIFITAYIILFTAELENRFLNLMHMYFFHDASIYPLAFYFLIVPAVLSFMGFEVINRTAKITGTVFIAVHVLYLISSYSSYEAYKIYPVMGDGAYSLSTFALQSVGLFLPAVIVSLTAMRGQNGLETSNIIMRRSVITSVAVCAVTLLLLAFSATYDDLSHLYMPLYRMSMTSGQENFILRLDKISAFIWTVASLCTCSYCMYGSSLLYCRAFGQKDIRPASLTLCISTTVLVLLYHSGNLNNLDFLQKIHQDTGVLLALPVMSASVIALIKSRKHKKGDNSL